MSTSQGSRVKPVVIVLLLIASGAGFATYWFRVRQAALPGPGTPAYQAYRRAFQVGVAALEAGREELARPRLTEATALIPGEPAAWANLGLMSLRKNDLQQAEKDLKKAHALAPDSGEIEALLALLAEKQGRLPEAVAHYRKAIAANPRDLASLFALAETISREGGVGSEAEYQKLMEQILQAQPNNLPVLTRRAGAALRNQDQAAFQDTLDRFARLAPDWSALSRKVLAELQQVSKKPNEAIPVLQDLDRVLKGERSYQRDGFVILPQPAVVGSPIVRFLRLVPPTPGPAAPDRDLTFRIEALSAPAKANGLPTALGLAWLFTEKQRKALEQHAAQGVADASALAGFTPTVFVANAKEVRPANKASPGFSFPGGPKGIAPTSASVLPVDWDNDLRIDFVLAGAGGLRFWQQRLGGSFDDITGKTGLAADILNGEYHGVWAADIEMDSDLDLIAARRTGAPLLLRNNGDNTFKAFESFAGVKNVRAFAWADLDSDGAPDATFLDDQGRLHVFTNDRSGLFSPWPLPADLGTFVAVTAADINNDGVFDLVALRSDGALMRISDQGQRQAWQVAEIARVPLEEKAPPGDIALFVEDLDNNGALDILVAGPKSAQIVLGADEPRFITLARSIPLRVLAVHDVNNDGRLDLLGLSAADQPAQALNQSTKKYRWQALRPIANPLAGDGRINSFGLGGEVEIRSGALVQKHLIHAPVVHFGLGEEDAVDVARIVWPNGAAQYEFAGPSDQLVTAVQRLTTSCPFLFTFDGKGMRFAGDFMWGTPLGMYINGQNIGDFPETTEWLKIPGKHLLPRDGYYDVRVHANLWEADYFDKLALIVVDHPPETEIHVDERFFLTPTKPRLHVTTPVKPVARAWDHHGKDATAEIRAIDGAYLDRCGRGRFQGVTQDHWVEVDLGEDAPRAGPVLLIARGWLHPTNSSINVALGQGKHAAPRPLVLEVPDGKGGWKVGRPALGFPAGKDKTLLIRLDGIEGKQVSRRFRLRTSMEIYWDFLGYATELDEKLARLQRPAPLSADLRFRGVLAMSRKNDSSPEVPDYYQVIRTAQPWRDLTGYYTRFGDVGELLANVDDRYVIANAGDEIALRFPVPAAPSGGWQRDFIWECDGWTRDGDPNTRFGTGVLPLPAHGVNTDLRPPTRLQDDPVYQRFPADWRNYHTRYVTAHAFARGLRRLRNP
ncbi:MAG: VCBS repeat-containing protein [Planctomycetes bacterium]|nr:VCBS repeat-containing protein [Planctomycetota bacterium]